MNRQWIYSATEIPHTAQQVIENMHQKGCHIVTLEGPLGAGKTSLVREMIRAYGVVDDITSPTFSYVNEYKGKDGVIIFHFDLYRIESVDEFLAAGFGEYLHQPRSIIFIEWPAVIAPLLQKGVCRVTLDYEDELQKRSIKITCSS